MRNGSRIRLGVIGLGAMGGRTLAVAASHPDFEVVRCADPSAAAVERARSRHPEAGYTQDPDELLDDDGIDAVYIAAPPAAHARYAVRAMKAGRAVFCEKPLAISAEEGAEMVAAAEAAGVVNAVNFALSDRNSVREMARALRDGEVGTVLGVDMTMTFPRWPRTFQQDAAWLARREQGGFIREVASHFLFLTDRLVGPLTPVHTSVSYGPGEGSAELTASGLFDVAGVPVRLSGQTAAAPETYEWTLYGSSRSYRLTRWSDLWLGGPDGWTRVELDGPAGSEHTRLSEFARAIRGGASTLADFATGLRVQRLAEAFHRP